MIALACVCLAKRVGREEREEGEEGERGEREERERGERERLCAPPNGR